MPVIGTFRLAVGGGGNSCVLTSNTKLWPFQQHCLLHNTARHTANTPQLTSSISAAFVPSSAPCISRHSGRCQALTTAAAAQRPPSTDDNQDQQDSTNTNEQKPQQQQQQQLRLDERAAKSDTGSGTGSPFSIDDPQLLVGDCVALTAAALYRQIAAIVLSPTFPGWFAPLSFNPLRFVEFANFGGMLVAAWVVAATLTGGYSGSAVGAGVPGALRAVCRAWLVAMPISAAHLVLVTASESQALVGDEGFAGVLPLAAAGPGEPLGTAAAVLGLMAMWRAFYAVYLDTWAWASARNVAEDAAGFREALASVALVAAGCSIVLQVLQLSATLSEGGADAAGLLG